MKIAVIGSINIDFVYEVPHIVKPGETIHSTDYHTFFGGKGANQAITMAQLGEEVAFIGCVGQDDFGTQALKNLRDYSVSTTHVRQSGITGHAIIQVSDSGENSIVLFKGANDRLSTEQVLDSEEVIRSASAVLLQLEVPLSSVEAGITLAEKHGVPVILNPAPAQYLSQGILSKVDVLTPNETELATLTGMEIDTDEKMKKACLALIEKGVKAVVVTLGRQGAYVTDGNFSAKIPAIPAKVVDTTGAGDAFNGAP